MSWSPNKWFWVSHFSQRSKVGAKAITIILGRITSQENIGIFSSEMFIIEKLVRCLFHSWTSTCSWQISSTGNLSQSSSFFNPSWQLQYLSPSSREEVKINVHLLLLFFQEQTVHQIFNFSIDRQSGLSPRHLSIHLNNGWSAPTQGWIFYNCGAVFLLIPVPQMVVSVHKVVEAVVLPCTFLSCMPNLLVQRF